MNPGMRALLVRKTFTSLKTTAITTYRTFVANELLQAGQVEWRTADSEFRYANGSVLVTGGMDKASRIMSSEYDVIFVQEATELTEDDWEALTTRLRNGKVSFQQLIGDCNPDTPTHWLRQRMDKGQTKSLPTKHEDNPILFDDEMNLTERGKDYLDKLDNLTGVRYLRLRKGQWVAAEGMIFEDFAPVHLIDEMPKGWETWTRYWTVDFGFTNPFVLQCWAEDPDGRLYLYREIYRTQRLVEDHAKDILALVQDEKGSWTELKPRAIICDHDAEGRATLEKVLGFSTVAAHKKVNEGIQAVQARLKLAGDGRPRLFIVRDCLTRRDHGLSDAKKPTCTLEEIPGYVWDAKKEAPVKEDDHGCDAMRYMAAHRDLQGTARFRGWVNV
jgi:phage terminase large subunit